MFSRPNFRNEHKSRAFRAAINASHTKTSYIRSYDIELLSIIYIPVCFLLVDMGDHSLREYNPGLDSVLNAERGLYDDISNQRNARYQV